MNEKGLLAVSFGTSVPEAEPAIANVESALREAFPERAFGRAFTSRIICRKLAREGRPVDSPEKAMEKMLAAGVRDLLVQPTHLTPGDEYDKLCRIVEGYRDRFDAVRVGRPLIADAVDLRLVADTVLQRFPDRESGALLLMGHGSEHFANLIYAALQTAFRLAGAEDVFVGTVESWPRFEDCLPRLKALGRKKVELAPLMLVAGDHARNDMAGEEEDSWRRRLEKEGFEVTWSLEGMGLWEEIAALYRAHAEECLGR